jgi:hypothetical protein
MTMQEIIESIKPESKDFEVITLQDLQVALQTSKGAKIVSLITMTIPDLRQLPGTNCVFDYELIKISYINGMVNFNYASAVNAQRKREGKEPDFVPLPRKWGTRLSNSPFVAHVLKTTGEHKLYLEVRILKSIDHQYIQPSKGIIIDNEAVKPYLREKPQQITQDLEKEIIHRDYDVKNIACIIIDKKGYFITENLK